MRKIFNSMVAIVMLCAICFLGGAWPENTPRKKVVACDGVALTVVAVCGIYLKKEERNGRLR